MSKLRRILLPVLCLLPLGGCMSAAILSNVGSNFFLRQDVNLTEKNYAAADYLAGLTHATLNRSTPVYVGRLNHANETGITSAFASVVPEQVGARLAQLGYNVKMQSAGQYDYDQNVTKRGVILTGNYLPNSPNADVHLRLIHNNDGHLVGAFDYTIPVNMEIAGLLEPRPTTIQMAPSSQGELQHAIENNAESGEDDLPLRLLGAAP